MPESHPEEKTRILMSLWAKGMDTTASVDLIAKAERETNTTASESKGCYLPVNTYT